jgi:hypothetical protein
MKLSEEFFINLPNVDHIKIWKSKTIWVENPSFSRVTRIFRKY